MRHGRKIAVIIPAFDEADAIGKVISSVPDWVDKTIVTDNASRDNTAAIARAHGAHVVHEPQPGYGAACLRGLEALTDHDIVVFMDGDYSDRGCEMHLLVDPITNDLADMVIGSRTLGTAETGSLTPQQRWGNWLACSLIRLFWGVSYTDLGPYRAISAHSLKAIHMQDRAFGWTVEMQLKAILHDLRWHEVPVSYFNRIGVSKISGTVRGTILAGHAIIWTILRTALTARHEKTRPDTG
jgi:glycosyltransferase involved in cell wall biosynthesis